jgi:hypothetical protein
LSAIVDTYKPNLQNSQNVAASPGEKPQSVCAIVKLQKIYMSLFVLAIVYQQVEFQQEKSEGC